jgi:hypothetical protein
MEEIIFDERRSALEKEVLPRQNVKDLIDHLVAPMPMVTEYLRQVFIGGDITINPMDGIQTIAKSRNVFTGYIDKNFVLWNLDKTSKPTKKTWAVVYEMTKYGIFLEIFGSFGRCLDSLCFTQSQVIDFVVNHKDKLHQDGYGMFFLFKKDDTIFSKDDPNNENLFIADVRVRSCGYLRVHVDSFSVDNMGIAECPCRFVFPQQTL